MFRQDLEKKSGSYGGSGVGQAPELPLESDLRLERVITAKASHPVPQPISPFRQIIQSFSLESLRQTSAELVSAFVPALVPKKQVEKAVDETVENVVAPVAVSPPEVPTVQDQPQLAEVDVELIAQYLSITHGVLAEQIVPEKRTIKRDPSRLNKEEFATATPVFPQPRQQLQPEALVAVEENPEKTPESVELVLPMAQQNLEAFSEALYLALVWSEPQQVASALLPSVVTSLAHLDQRSEKLPKKPVQPPIVGAIHLGDTIFQEENLDLRKLEVEELPKSAPKKARLNLFKKFYVELDIAFWLWKVKSFLSFKQFTLNPWPAYAKAMRYAGTGFIGVSLFTFIFFGAPYLALELRSFVLRVTTPFLSQADLERQPMVANQSIELPEQGKEFQIKIPIIGVDSRVIANVDAANPKEYEDALKLGVAHAKGTGFPGNDGGVNKSIFIFSHSTNASWNITRFNAQFYSLKDLQKDDQIQMWFWGKEYWYKVVEKKIVKDNDVSFLKPQMDKELLILQTCWPPGTVQKRLIIIAERVEK